MTHLAFTLSDWLPAPDFLERYQQLSIVGILLLVLIGGMVFMGVLSYFAYRATREIVKALTAHQVKQDAMMNACESVHERIDAVVMCNPEECQSPMRHRFPHRPVFPPTAPTPNAPA